MFPATTHTPVMVRESRHVLVSGLPDNFPEDKINAFFSVYGRVQKLERCPDGVVVSFMDVRTAQKAHSAQKGDQRPELGHTFRLSFHEPATTSTTKNGIMTSSIAGPSTSSNSPKPHLESRRRSQSPRCPKENRSQNRQSSLMGGTKRSHRREGRSPEPGSNNSSPCLSGIQGFYVDKLPSSRSNQTVCEGIQDALRKYGKLAHVLLEGEGSDRRAFVIYHTVFELEKLVAEKSVTVLGTRCRLRQAEPVDVQQANSNQLALITAVATGNRDTELPAKYASPNNGQRGGEVDVYSTKASRTLYVGNLESRQSEDVLRRRFEKFGDILDIDVKNYESPSPFAFIQFADIDSAVRAINTHARQSAPGAAKKGKPNFGRSIATNKLWVGAIPPSASEGYVDQKLKGMMDGAQDVFYDTYMRQALVTFSSLEQAQAGWSKIRNGICQLKCDGQESRLSVDYCSDRLLNFFLDRLHNRPSSGSGGGDTTTAALPAAPSSLPAGNSLSSPAPPQSSSLLIPPPDPPSDMPAYGYRYDHRDLRRSPSHSRRRDRSRTKSRHSSRDRSRDRSRHRKSSRYGDYDRSSSRRKDRKDRRASTSPHSSRSSSADSSGSSESGGSSPVSYSQSQQRRGEGRSDRDRRRTGDDRRDRDSRRRPSGGRRSSPFGTINGTPKWTEKHQQREEIAMAAIAADRERIELATQQERAQSGDSGFCEESRAPLDPPPAPPTMERVQSLPTPPPNDPPPAPPSTSHAQLMSPPTQQPSTSRDQGDIPPPPTRHDSFHFSQPPHQHRPSGSDYRRDSKDHHHVPQTLHPQHRHHSIAGSSHSELGKRPSLESQHRISLDGHASSSQQHRDQHQHHHQHQQHSTGPPRPHHQNTGGNQIRSAERQAHQSKANKDHADNDGPPLSTTAPSRYPWPVYIKMAFVLPQETINPLATVDPRGEEGPYPNPDRNLSSFWPVFDWKDGPAEGAEKPKPLELEPRKRSSGSAHSYDAFTIRRISSGSSRIQSIDDSSTPARPGMSNAIASRSSSSAGSDAHLSPSGAEARGIVAPASSSLDFLSSDPHGSHPEVTNNTMLARIDTIESRVMEVESSYKSLREAAVRPAVDAEASPRPIVTNNFDERIAQLRARKGRPEFSLPSISLEKKQPLPSTSAPSSSASSSLPKAQMSAVPPPSPSTAPPAATASLSSCGFSRNTTARPALQIQIPNQGVGSQYGSSMGTPGSARTDYSPMASRVSNGPLSASQQTRPVPVFPATAPSTATLVNSHLPMASPIISAPPPPPQLPLTNSVRDPVSLKSPPMTPSSSQVWKTGGHTPSTSAAVTPNTRTPLPANHRGSPATPKSSLPVRHPMTSQLQQQQQHLMSKQPVVPPSSVSQRHDSTSSLKSPPLPTAGSLAGRSMSVSEVKKSATAEPPLPGYMMKLFNEKQSSSSSNSAPTASDIRRLPKIEKKVSASANASADKEKTEKHRDKEHKKSKEHKQRRNQDGSLETKEERAIRKELERAGKKEKSSRKDKLEKSEKENKKEKKHKEHRKKSKEEERERKKSKSKKDDKERDRSSVDSKSKKMKKKKSRQDSEEERSESSESDGDSFVKSFYKSAVDAAGGPLVGQSMYDRVKRRSSAATKDDAKKSALKALRDKKKGSRKRVQLDSSDEDDEGGEQLSQRKEDSSDSSDEETSVAAASASGRPDTTAAADSSDAVEEREKVSPPTKTLKKKKSSPKPASYSSSESDSDSEKEKKKKKKAATFTMDDVFGRDSSDGSESTAPVFVANDKKRSKRKSVSTTDESDNQPTGKKKILDYESIFGSDRPEKQPKKIKKDKTSSSSSASVAPVVPAAATPAQAAVVAAKAARKRTLDDEHDKSSKRTKRGSLGSDTSLDMDTTGSTAQHVGSSKQRLSSKSSEDNDENATTADVKKSSVVVVDSTLATASTGESSSLSDSSATCSAKVIPAVLPKLSEERAIDSDAKQPAKLSSSTTTAPAGSAKVLSKGAMKVFDMTPCTSVQLPASSSSDLGLRVASDEDEDSSDDDDFEAEMTSFHNHLAATTTTTTIQNPMLLSQQRERFDSTASSSSAPAPSEGAEESDVDSNLSAVVRNRVEMVDATAGFTSLGTRGSTPLPQSSPQTSAAVKEPSPDKMEVDETEGPSTSDHTPAEEEEEQHQSEAVVGEVSPETEAPLAVTNAPEMEEASLPVDQEGDDGIMDLTGQFVDEESEKAVLAITHDDHQETEDAVQSIFDDYEEEQEPQYPSHDFIRGTTVDTQSSAAADTATSSSDAAPVAATSTSPYVVLSEGPLDISEDQIMAESFVEEPLPDDEDEEEEASSISGKEDTVAATLTSVGGRTRTTSDSVDRRDSISERQEDAAAAEALESPTTSSPTQMMSLANPFASLGSPPKKAAPIPVVEVPTVHQHVQEPPTVTPPMAPAPASVSVPMMSSVSGAMASPATTTLVSPDVIHGVVPPTVPVVQAVQPSVIQTQSALTSPVPRTPSTSSQPPSATVQQHSQQQTLPALQPQQMQIYNQQQPTPVAQKKASLPVTTVGGMPSPSSAAGSLTHGVPMSMASSHSMLTPAQQQQILMNHHQQQQQQQQNHQQQKVLVTTAALAASTSVSAAPTTASPVLRQKQQQLQQHQQQQQQILHQHILQQQYLQMQMQLDPALFQNYYQQLLASVGNKYADEWLRQTAKQQQDQYKRMAPMMQQHPTSSASAATSQAWNQMILQQHQQQQAIRNLQQQQQQPSPAMSHASSASSLPATAHPDVVATAHSAVSQQQAANTSTFSVSAAQLQQLQQQQQQQQATSRDEQLQLTNPVVWRGQLQMKQNEAQVQLHLINGNRDFIFNTLGPLMEMGGSDLKIHINQRMRTDLPSMRNVMNRLARCGTACICVPIGLTKDECNSNNLSLRTHFLEYFANKAAAGIAMLPATNTAPASLVYVFPPNETTEKYMLESCRPMYTRVKSNNSLGYLFVVVLPQEDPPAPTAAAPAPVVAAT